GDRAGAQVGHRYSAAVPELSGLTTLTPALSRKRERDERSQRVRDSTPAQRADDDDLVVRGECGTEVGRLLLVDEDPDVAPDRVLLVDHAEADPRIAPLEVREQRGERRPARFHVRAPAGVVAKLRGDEDGHRLQPPAAST